MSGERSLEFLLLERVAKASEGEAVGIRIMPGTDRTIVFIDLVGDDLKNIRSLDAWFYSPMPGADRLLLTVVFTINSTSVRSAARRVEYELATEMDRAVIEIVTFLKEGAINEQKPKDGR